MAHRRPKNRYRRRIARDRGRRIAVETLEARRLLALLIPRGSEWSYLDDGSDQGTAWREAGFDDQDWSVGAAQLGYGDGDEQTVVGYGDPNDKYVTTYFRHAFQLDEDPADVDRLEVLLLRDDGAAVYLNGQELIRDNLRESADYQTFANGNAQDEYTFRSFWIDVEGLPSGTLVPGTNVVAVEVHQSTAGSSDLSFDLELSTTSGDVPGSPDVDYYLVAPHKHFGSLPSGQFDSRSVTIHVDPSDSGWVAWNMYPDVRTTTPSRGDELLLGALTAGVDDYFQLTVTNPLGESLTVALDQNDGAGGPQGPQAVIYGTANDAPDVLRADNQGSAMVFDESGAHNSLFTVAGDYRFDFAFQNIGGQAHYPDVWLLVDRPVRTSEALDDAYETIEDETLSVPVEQGVLGNDTHETGLPLTAQLRTDARNGTLVLAEDGSFTYTPDPDFHGSDTFTYAATDGQYPSRPATVTITVASVTDPPAAGQDSYTVAEDEVLNVVHAGLPRVGLVHHWPFDETGGDLASDVVGGNDGTLYGWNATENRWVPGKIDGALDFDSDNDYLLTQSGAAHDRFTVAFWLKLEGGGGFNPRIVTARDSAWVTYHRSPNQGVGSHGPRVPTHPKIDEWEHYTVTFDQVERTAAVYMNGALVVERSNDIAYGVEPVLMGHSQNLGAHVDSLDGVLDDVRLYDRQLLASEIAAFIGDKGVLDNDRSEQQAPLIAELVDDVEHGSLTLHADGTFQYVPDPEFSGTDGFRYQARSGELVSQPTLVTIAVEPVDDAPAAADDSYSTAEDADLVVDAVGGILANDSDVEGSPLTALLVQDASHGTLQLLADGSFSYAPDPDFFGVDRFTYQAGDGQGYSAPAEVTITVTAEPDAPDAVDDTYSIWEDETLETSDVVTPPVTESLVPESSIWRYQDDGSNQGTAWREPGFDDADWASGPSELGYGDGDEATVVGYGDDDREKYATTYFRHEFDAEEINLLQNLSMNLKWDDAVAVYLNGVEVLREGLAPDASYDDYALSPRSDESAYQQRSVPAELLVEGTNVLAAEVHQYSGNSSDISFDLRLFAESRTSLGGVLTNDRDVDGDSFGATLIQGPSRGDLTFEQDGSFHYEPEADFFGTDAFTYRLEDETGLTDTAVVTIRVRPVNDPPVARDDRYSLVGVEPLAVDAESGVLANDFDTESELTVRLGEAPGRGTLVLNGDGSFEYTPGDGFSTTDTFTYVVDDGHVESEPATVTILADIPTIEVGDHPVLPDSSNQIVDIFVRGDHDITGVNIRAQLGDGSGPLTEPIFQAVDFAGGIWDVAEITVGGGPVPGAAQFVQANAQFTAQGATTTAAGRLVRLIVDTTGISEGTFDLLLKDSEIGGDTDFVGSPAHVVNGTITIANSTVVGRHVFYNGSYFDGDDSQVNADDDSAIAVDKSALLPGRTATFANYTSALSGITGVMVDVQGLVSEPGPTDFEFRVGNDDRPDLWSDAPPPREIVVRPGAGVEGSDRITIVWPEQAIRKQWLQVTVRSAGATGLASPDVFYFGNAVGDAGDSPDFVFVDGTDFALARDNPRNFLDRAPIDFPYDYNRDSFVDGFDLAVARDNGTNFLTALKLITAADIDAEPPPGGGLAAAAIELPAPREPTTGAKEAGDEVPAVLRRDAVDLLMADPRRLRVESSETVDEPDTDERSGSKPLEDMLRLLAEERPEGQIR